MRPRCSGVRRIYLKCLLTAHKNNHKNLESLLEEVNSISIPIFPISGKHLLERGIKSGMKIGEVLKKIEKDWIDNDFHLNDDELENLISKYI